MMLHSAKYRVLVTRPEHQAEKLSLLIEQQHWNAIRFPTLEINPINTPALQQQLTQVSHYQWVIFISANAVNFAIKANNGKIDCFKQSRLIAIGKATEKALLLVGLIADLLPPQSNTESLLTMNEMAEMTEQSCLIIRGENGRELLAETLRHRGAKVDYMAVYQRTVPKINNSELSHLLQTNQLNVITITSGNALKNLLLMLNYALHSALFAIPLVVISERIKQLAQKMGFKHIAVSHYPSDDAIIETIVEMKKWGIE